MNTMNSTKRRKTHSFSQNPGIDSIEKLKHMKPEEEVTEESDKSSDFNEKYQSKLKSQ